MFNITIIYNDGNYETTTVPSIPKFIKKLTFLASDLISGHVHQLNITYSQS